MSFFNKQSIQASNAKNFRVSSCEFNWLMEGTFTFTETERALVKLLSLDETLWLYCLNKTSSVVLFIFSVWCYETWLFKGRLLVTQGWISVPVSFSSCDQSWISASDPFLTCQYSARHCIPIPKIMGKRLGNKTVVQMRVEQFQLVFAQAVLNTMK